MGDFGQKKGVGGRGGWGGSHVKDVSPLALIPTKKSPWKKAPLLELNILEWPGNLHII